MRINRLVMVLSFSTFAACDVELLTSVEDTTQALESAQTDFCTFRAEADACRQAFEACAAVAGADLEACRTALHACLPPPPERRDGGRGGCEGGDGGVRRPPPDGDERRPGGRHHGGRGPHPEPAAVAVCRDALNACQAANPEDTTCVATERTCVRDAFRAAFDAACAAAATTCESLPSDACARLTARCAEGIDGRVEADGGICTAAAEVIP
ncbi:MAG: hypothetical protein Q8N23_28485 [Archangium sp.]|nr:hypothetical protein [Archangium sp.]MDP3570584.1 hypothetical protein [Archangium sp.]